MKKIHFIFLSCFFSTLSFSQEIGEIFPLWQKRYMDIHHINTGYGECTFFILPDGTTMLIDAGENNPDNIRHVPAVPNGSKSPAEWILKYTAHFAPNNPKLDYALITHFHSDHMGGVFKTKNSSGKYYETGIITIAEHMEIGKLVDRAFPDYTWLIDDRDKIVNNYLAFQKNTSRHFTLERFKTGYDNQFNLLYDTISYASSFSIRNIYANGDLWTGKGISTRHLFPDMGTVETYDKPRENTLSCAIKISYGDFSYYTGGDISGYPRPGRSLWHDVESQMAPVIGQVDVCVVNHHGNNDATNDTFISTLQPNVFVIMTSDALHPNHTTLYRMLSKQLYPDKRDVFSTNLHKAAKVVVGDLTDQMKSTQGHIVIRVFPGGKKYFVYILDDNNTNYRIKSVFGPYNCKQKI